MMVKPKNSQKRCHYNNYSQKFLMFLEDQTGDTMNSQPKLPHLKKKKPKLNIYYQKKENLSIYNSSKKLSHMLTSSKCSHLLLPPSITLPNIFLSLNQDFILLPLTPIGLVIRSNCALSLMTGPPQIKIIKEVFALIILPKLQLDLILLLNQSQLQLYHQPQKPQLI